jgi:phosphoribosyl 1,2-cyclic phosphate phosphodiesterase
MHKRFYYAFDQDFGYPGKPRVHSEIINQSPFLIGNVIIEPILVDHGGMDIFGFRIGSLAYITDAKTIPAHSLEKLKDLDVLVLNALRYEPHMTHLTLPEALQLCEELKPKQCYLTHISHEMGLHDVVNGTLPDHVRLGYDGLTIKVNG